MDDSLAYTIPRPDLPEPSGLLADPLFHLESQRQMSLRHLRRMERLQAATESDADFISAEEQAKDVLLAKMRLKADLKTLGTMIDELRSASAERRRDWRWSMPVLYVLCRTESLYPRNPLLSLDRALPIITLGNWIPLPRLQRNWTIVLALALLAAQTARRESAPRIYGLLHERIMWLNDTITIQESVTKRITNQDIAAETNTFPLTSSNSKDEDILGRRWWNLLPYL